MLYKKLSDGYLVRLVRGEEVRAGLSELMKREQIGCGFVTGLGAVSDPEMGYYRLAEKDYIKKRFEGEHEVVGMTGTLSWYNGKPFPHVHMMLTEPDFNAVGGHCFEATTSATIEMFVRAERDRVDRVDRALDEAIGLHLMQLPESCPIGRWDV